MMYSFALGLSNSIVFTIMNAITIVPPVLIYNNSIKDNVP